jgi:hypothetical protein
MFKFDFETLTWHREIPLEDSVIPPGLRSHASVVYENEMYMYGGTSSNDSSLNGELYSYNFGIFPNS